MQPGLRLGALLLTLAAASASATAPSPDRKVCNTHLVPGKGSTTLPPASTSTQVVKKTVTPVAVSTKTIVPPQITSTQISPIIVTATTSLATSTDDITVTSTNFAISVPTTTQTFPTVTPTVTVFQTSTSTTTSVVTSYTSLSPQPSIYPPPALPDLGARGLSDELAARELPIDAAAGRRALAGVIAERGSVRANCRPRPKPGANKRKVVQCTPVTTSTSTFFAKPKKTVTSTTTSLLPAATSTSYITGTVTTTVVPSTTVVQTVFTDLTITAPTLTLSYTPTASPSATVSTVVASAQQTNVIGLNQLCSPDALAARSREIDPYASLLQVPGQVTVDQSVTTFPDIATCCSSIAALDGAIGFTYYASGIYQGTCRGLIDDPNSADANQCSADDPASFLVDTLSPGSGVFDGLLQCGSQFGLPSL